MSGTGGPVPNGIICEQLDTNAHKVLTKSCPFIYVHIAQVIALYLQPFKSNFILVLVKFMCLISADFLRLKSND